MSDSRSPTASPQEAAVGSSSRLWQGIGWGILATIGMSIPMLIGMGTGVAPMPEPIPRALVTLIFGVGLPDPLLVAMAAGSHLAYGGIFGGLLARLTRPVTVWTGLALGLVLWLIMQVVVLPLLGWGAFGGAVTPAIAVATLALHLLYGAILGWGLDR